MNATADFTMPVRVEFEDVDSYRIAHHARLIVYLERCRVRLLEKAGFDLHDQRLQLVVYSLATRFLKPARLGDILEVTAAVAAVDSLRIVLTCRIRRGSELLVKAETTLAFADAATGRVEPVPQLVAQQLRSMA